MQRTAFYIVERVQPGGERGEVKEMEPDPTEGLAPIEASLPLTTLCVRAVSIRVRFTSFS